MKQWVVVEETPSKQTVAVYGPFDNEGLAKAFADAYEQAIHRYCRVFELNHALNKGE